MMKVTITNKSYPIATCELSGELAMLGRYLTEKYPVELSPLLKQALESIQMVIDGELISISANVDTALRDDTWYRIDIGQLYTDMKLQTVMSRYDSDNHIAMLTRTLLDIMSKWYNVTSPLGRIQYD